MGGNPDRRDSEACKEAWTEFCATGYSHVSKTHGQPAIRPSENKMQTVPDEHKREDVDILRVAMNLRNGHNISYFKVYRIIKEKGLMISLFFLLPTTGIKKAKRGKKYSRGRICCTKSFPRLQQ